MSIVVSMTTSDVERNRGFVAAKAALMRGECVVMPTDTVYGIAANPFVPTGITNLLSAKERDRGMPIPVLVPNLDAAFALSYNLSDAAKLIMNKFWPGAITIITKSHPTLKWELADADGTIALRIPLQRTALELLTQTGPLAVASANVGEAEPAVDVITAQQQFGTKVSVYLDAGPTKGEQASTIIDATQSKLRVIRAGAVLISDIVEVTGGTEMIAGNNE